MSVTVDLGILVSGSRLFSRRFAVGLAVLLGVVAGLVVSAAFLASAARAANRVYWANFNAGKVSFANLDGTGGGGDVNTTGATVNGIVAVAIDSAAGRIYWANTTGISFANLDGSGGGGDLNLTGATSPQDGITGLAVDPAAGRVYWTKFLYPYKISFAKLDGSGGGDLNTAGATLDSPYGVTVDPTAGRIYWANRAGRVSFAELDGSGGGGDLNLTGAAMPTFPAGVAVDPAAGRIYWANNGDAPVPPFIPPFNQISFANLDGSGGGGDVNTTGATPPNFPAGVAVDPAAGRIYWGNEKANPNEMSFAKLDGSGGGDLSTTGATPSSDRRFPVLLEAPSGVGAPAITGGSAPGSVLSCSSASWAADLLGSFLYRAPHTIAYQWSLGGTDIPGANTSSYTAAAAGDYRCRVTASNVAGVASQTSGPHTVKPRVPTSKDQCKNGGWRNYPQFKNQGQCVRFIETGK